jgi:hypothetical protein
VDAVRAFNKRIAATGQQLPDTPRPEWMPHMEVFLAMEDGAVRGGYILRRQYFWAGGKRFTAAHYRLPLSEGLVDRKYASLGLRLVRDALAREQRLYALGMGGWDHPLPQMLKRLHWRMCEVPFHFKVLRAARFLRNIRAVRTNIFRKLAMDAAAITGLGSLGMKLLSHGVPVSPEQREMADTFESWADEVWQQSREAYALLAERDALELESVYPPRDQRFLRVRAGGGWALMLDTAMKNHKQFGNMRVGSIVDCLAPPGEAASVMLAAASVLESRGVDLMISNQLHQDWSLALKGAGFVAGPSNYLLGLSPALAEEAAGVPESRFHFNRGDGDGPIHL